MQHMGHAMPFENANHRREIPKINPLKNVALVAIQPFEIFKMTGIAEAIQIDQQRDSGLLQQMPKQVAANKTGTTRDQEFHDPGDVTSPTGIYFVMLLDRMLF